MIPLKGKIAVVTGASRGIGRAIVLALAREGLQLGLLARSRPPADVPGTFVPCDLADLDSIPAAVRQLRAQLGPIDFLINNAGTFLEKSVPETPRADWERTLRVNLTAPFLLCQELLPEMIARRQGKIINIASTASTQGYRHQAAYCASKHALLGFARSLALEAKPHNVHVHTLCPGGVDTDLIKGTDLGARLQGRPLIAPADVAALVVFLLRQPDHLDLPELIVRRFDPAA